MILRDLALGRAIDAPVALVVAHPDDETLGTGARMSCLRQLVLIHLTDGAPRLPGEPDDSARRGAVAAERMREVDGSLDVLGARPQRRIAYGWPDQESIRHLPEIVAALRRDLEGVAAVLTHAYEHGHPDHDTAALAVHVACNDPDGRARPQVIEFPSYHLGANGARFGQFWRDPGRREWLATLDVRERARKARALACFASQRDMLRNFPVDVERFRRAPAYDFSQPAPPPAAWYDARQWPIDSRAWRNLARESLARTEQPA
ncbi:MAG TPA: PIG-L family deacetylase [Rhodanobacteraceae bacterium]|nr:PIG-L family deacetylase [Rhodanobacteraceae bacterium]